MRTPEQEIKLNKKFLAVLCALLLLLPGLLCLMVDLLTGTGLSWSIYPSGALLLLFAASLIPIYLPRHRVYTSLGLDFLFLSAFFFMVERVSHSGSWFFPIVFPSLALATVMLAHLIIFYRKEKLNKLTLPAASILAIGIECMFIESIHCLALGHPVSFHWAVYVAAPCIFLCLALFFINSSRAVREELKRRLHY